MRWRRRKREEQQAGGEDSFLDIVANLVGILVILVMVIGVRAQGAYVDSQSARPAEPPQRLVEEREQARRSHDSLARSVHEMKQQADQTALVALQREREKQQLQRVLVAARRELDERRAELDDDGQAQVQLAATVRELEHELSQLERQRQLLEQESHETKELEHLPTPMAKTVFGQEEHFRLLNGRVVYVPLNELTELLKDELPREVYRLKDVPQLTQTIGPVQGFHLRYTMQRRTVQAGPVVREVAELKQFVLLPVSESMGEPVDEALQTGSQFRQMLEAMRPGATVITVWTYPDSYGAYRELKRWLFDRGYSSAARPLPDGQLISGSPEGSRSSAQ